MWQAVTEIGEEPQVALEDAAASGAAFAASLEVDCDGSRAAGGWRDLVAPSLDPHERQDPTLQI